MSTDSILLRVLLCLCLIVQGSQAPFAASGMAHPMPHVAMTSHAAAPCDAQGNAGMTAHAATRMAGHAMPSGSGHPKPDCCQHGMCSCDCAQFAIADVLPQPTLRVDSAPQRVLLPMDDGRPAPVLPHLIRPPIG